MKKLFTKKNKDAVITDPIANADASAKKAVIMNKIALGINAGTLIATPAVIKLVTDKIDDDEAKKALYITGGLLWVYQLSDTINSAKAVKHATAFYDRIKELSADIVESEGVYLIENLNEMEESMNG